ncbi:hypothetical protein CFOL_v3_00281 [Cephalotus follicularis]|uniref:Uncharacterized protein n=1 Tax=Cephalotus follicularis TaxID=3775 RepID=A0A1Q3ALW3_CEPFO|nr:hypothetical protein CFOL_v3_00281 [Cephalotus follicularis]
MEEIFNYSQDLCVCSSLMCSGHVIGDYNLCQFPSQTSPHKLFVKMPQPSWFSIHPLTHYMFTLIAYSISKPQSFWWLFLFGWTVGVWISCNGLITPCCFCMILYNNL